MLIIRSNLGNLEILMGKRGKRAVFGNAYVFPGGKVDRGDTLSRPATNLHPDLSRRLSSDPKISTTFALTAVRETFEETGLLLGSPGDVGETGNDSWDQIRGTGLAPNLAKLSYVGHAITPASKAARFNTRFFCAWADDMHGSLQGSGELSDLGFVKPQDALALPMVDVTQYMLHEILRREENGFTPPTTYPFFGYRKNSAYKLFQ